MKTLEDDLQKREAPRISKESEDWMSMVFEDPAFYLEEPRMRPAERDA